MSNPFETFTKTKDYLVCVDSDGCAMDTMDIKHFKCFGPCMVREWHLERWADPILARWNEINLYTMTRGVNRFRGLAMALGEIDEKYTPIEGLDALREWVDTSPELSNGALQAAVRKNHSPALQKALNWSKAVNIAITALPDEAKRPFPHVAEGLAAAAEFADVAVVSSANLDAVQEEWARYKLLDHVDILLAQNAGSKAHCIAELLKKGYAPDHVVMIGDAPGDAAAAEKNGVYFYPILVRQEGDSWVELRETALPHLKDGSYAPYGAEKLAQFRENLGS